MAQAYLDNIKRGWKATQKRAVKRGAPPGTTPIGYTRIPKGQDSAGKLVPDPVYGPAITELFKRAATGRYGYSELARWFNERAPHPEGRRWWPVEVSRWLRNRKYLGESSYGALHNPKSHKPLTDPETFKRCQRKPGTRPTSNYGFLLTSLARCANCRYVLRGASRGGHNGRVPVYRCSASCGRGSVVTAARLEAYVVELVRQHLTELRLESAKDWSASRPGRMDSRPGSPIATPSRKHATRPTLKQSSSRPRHSMLTRSIARRCATCW